MQGQSSDMEISLKLILSMRQELYQILANHTGKTYEEIDSDSDRDYWLKAPEAKAYGLIDEVLVKKS
jgi:ATP-dependent Clp protease protease subunit